MSNITRASLRAHFKISCRVSSSDSEDKLTIPCLVPSPVYSMKRRSFSASTFSEFIGTISSEVFDEYDEFNCMDSSVDEEIDCSRRVQSF